MIQTAVMKLSGVHVEVGVDETKDIYLRVTTEDAPVLMSKAEANLLVAALTTAIDQQTDSH